MYMELKVAIINWLVENEHEWQRVNACVDNFTAYIYDKNGNFLIGGKKVLDFIEAADKLLYEKI